MNKEMAEILQGAAILFVVLIAAFFIGRFLNERKNAGYARVWKPLMPLIGGTVHADGGGASSSYLAGTFEGFSVVAGMTPNRNRYTDSTSNRYNYFELQMDNVPGAKDWNIRFHNPVLYAGKSGRQIDSDDAALVERLRESGVLELVTGMREPDITYRTSQRTLTMSGDMGSDVVPDPASFAEQLACLVRLRHINDAVNAV